MSDDERDRLLPKDDEGIRSASNTRTKWCFIFKLSIVLMLFKGCEEMFNTTVKQYIFAWCENFPSGQQNPGLDTTNGTENDTECGVKDETVAQKMASRWELYLNLFNAVLVYFSVSIGGTLSDHYGRKVFFCLALFGWLLRCGGTSVVVYFDLHIAWMFLGYGADGVFGSLYMISLITFASTADSTNGANERVFGITVMESVLGVGKLTTQFGNGYFIHRFGYFYPMLTATAGTLLSLIVAMATINEPQTEASALYDRPKPPLPSFRTFFRRYIGFYIDSDSEQKRTFSWICLIAFFLIMVSTLSRSDPLILYQLGSPFCWTSELIGWYNALYIFATLIVGCFLLRLLQYCISDPVIACVGTVSAILYSVLTGLAHSTEALFAGMLNISTVIII